MKHERVKMNDFKKSDIVIVLGATKTKKGITKIHRMLAKIIHVGRYDLFVESVTNSSYGYANSAFRASKKSCVIVRDDDAEPSGHIIEPKIGDLVLSYTKGVTNKAEVRTGILTDIIDKPGSSKQAKILKGAKSEIVMFSSLIILEY